MIFESQEKTIVKISDGKDGQSPISVIISSENGTVFNEDTNITQTTCTCHVYKGIEEIIPNSYEWVLKENSSEQWKTIGNTKTIKLPINKTIIRKQLKCNVDVTL